MIELIELMMMMMMMGKQDHHVLPTYPTISYLHARGLPHHAYDFRFLEEGAKEGRMGVCLRHR